MAQRFVIQFDADYPDDVEFGSAGEIERPAGYALAQALSDLLREEGFRVSEVRQRDYYGWSIDGRRDGVALSLVLQLVDRWLVALECHTGIVPFGRGKVDAALQAVHGRFASDRRFADLSWQTEIEHAAALSGANDGNSK